MIKKTIIKNGVKYIVNAPGWNDDVGPGAPAGTLWMQSITDGNWYAINLIGTSGSTAIYVNPTPLTWQSPGQDFPYQLLYCYQNDNVYQTYLSGSGANVTMSISQTPWPVSGDYKPYLWLQSITDQYFYAVYAKSGSITLFVDQNSKKWMYPPPEPYPSPPQPTPTPPTPPTPTVPELIITEPAGLVQSLGLYSWNGLSPDVTSITVYDTASYVGYDFELMQNVQEINFPNLVSIDSDGGSLYLADNPILTTITLPLFVPTTGHSYFFSNNILTDTVVNAILARFVANAGYVDGTIHLETGNAAPTGQGLIDKQTLLDRGINVITE